jgi:tetratricopeptide (TPR) repeat protein
MNKNKYLFGLIGLLLGFLASFFVTKSINESPAGAASAPARPGAAGQPSQQAMMGDVRAVIEKAKNNPQDYQAQIDAARAFAQINRNKEAAEFLEKAYQVNPAELGKLEGAVGFIGMHYMDEKNFAEAEKWFRRALDLSPDDAELHIELAATFLEREPAAPDRAIESLQQALRVAPKNGHAIGHLIEAYLHKKDARAAEDALGRLREAEPNNQRAAIYQNLIADLKAGKPITIPKE